jgi:alkylated DNA repair dioxygenase AlkB
MSAKRKKIGLQLDLFGAPTAIDRTFSSVRRIALDDACWVDHAESWVSGADALFQTIVESREWKQRTRRMYDRRVLEPRLTAPWNLASGVPLRPTLVEEMRVALGERYGVEFDSVGFNLYRDGRDSVAWHRDHIRREVEAPIIALVSLGERRKFLLRPRGGGASLAFALGRGDLLVTGGRTNRDWEHAVPKVARAGPRISLAFRYGMDPRAYAGKTEVPTEGAS